MKPVSLVVPALTLTLALAAAARAQAPPAAPASLRLRPGDQLMLQVKNEPGLSGRFPIGPEGSIMLPVIGALAAAELPFAEVENAIRTGLSRELAEPEIIVTPLQRVSVLGEVRLPGYQWLDTTGTVADLLVMAGGFLPTAKRGSLTLVRDGMERRLVFRDGVPEAVPLVSGDQLIVPRRGWLSENLPIFIGAAASVAAAAVTSLIVR